MKPYTQQRKFYLDFLRLIATLGVIFLHVSAKEYHMHYLTYDWYLSVIGDSLVRWCVPLFVMISGALFLNPDKHLSYRDILTKYIPRLLLAYVCWSLLYTIFQIAVSSFISREFVFDTYFLRPYFHLWFLPMLMGVYLLVPLLRKISEDKTLTQYALILWICVLTVAFFLNREILQISELFLINLVSGFAGYCLLGYFVSQHTMTKRQQALICTIGMAGLVITIGGNIFLSLHLGMPTERFLPYLSPFVVMTALSIFAFAKQKESALQGKLSGIVEYVRKDLFGIYLVHGMWLRFFNITLFRDLTNHAITLPLITIIIFIFSLFTTKLIRKIPYVRKIVE
jgi:surface polysaccharide O-acyltransferase-like enzyme